MVVQHLITSATNTGKGGLMPRKETPPKPKPLISKVCGACREDFVTHRPKAGRCQPCIDQGQKIKYRNCYECRSPFVLLDDLHLNCPSCADAFGLDQSTLSPEQIERLREEERLSEFINRRDSLLQWLKDRERRYKRKPPIPNPTQYDLTMLGLL